ncbi:MAG: hypothetical protein JW819_03030 [Candidatus Krumholzibacteriota bacterium]|nr:hypothetical protein [Candidatus Krumholzibacteriota bacterium]
MRRSDRRFLLFTATLAVGLGACNLAAPEVEADPAGAYATHVVAYGNALNDLDPARLDPYGLIIAEACAFDRLAPRHRQRALLYFNMWGKSCHSDSLRTWPIWQPAPGELGEPDVVMNGSVHCYRFDDAHVADLLSWIDAFLQAHAGSVRGVFLDDFGFDRLWWEGTDAARDSVWGPYDGRPGWREDPLWNRGRVEAVEAGALALVRQHLGPAGVVVVNGPARSLDGVRRFAEDCGAPRSEAWPRLEEPGVDPWRYARAGDLLQVNGVGESGQWGDWSETEAGNGLANLQRAAALARERGCSVGLAYGEPPRTGGSLYSLFLDPAAPDAAWPGYCPASD